MANIHKTLAIKLRKEGKSYREIQLHVPVAKSTLSNWLTNIQLSSEQLNRIQELGKQGRKRGNYVRQEKRKLDIKKIKELSHSLLTSISDRELWLIGIVLYWAEGNKQRNSYLSQGVKFSNSDPRMIRLFIKWLQQFENVSLDRLIIELYLHQSHLNEKKNIINYWSTHTGIPTSSFDRIYLKNTKPKRVYQNTPYFGVIRVTVRKSTSLNRKLSALADTICIRCGIV